MIDVQKLKYDLAMQSALAATILNRRLARSFSLAYRQYCSMNLSELKAELSVSEQVLFETLNALGKDLNFGLLLLRQIFRLK